MATQVSVIGPVSKTSTASVMVIPMFAFASKSKLPDIINKNEALKQLCRQGQFTGKQGESLWLYDLPGFARRWILLVGMGPVVTPANLALDTWRAALQHLAKVLYSRKLPSIVANILVDLTTIFPKQVTASLVQYTVLEVLAAAYTFDRYKSLKTSPKINPKLSVRVPTPSASLSQAAERGYWLHQSMLHLKNWVNTPGNICTPRYLAKEAKAIAATSSRLRCRVLGRAQMAKLKMGSLLSVTAGSLQEPQLVIVEYRGAAAKQAPLALVGKGVTFDTGGNSLKPALSMVGMKYDMAGAATMLALMHFAARARLPINLVAILPCVENMPGAAATRPDDIVVSMSGMTIEINNTDAEGRLILCDALTYVARQYRPAVIIDAATLTGACLIALGRERSALYSNDAALASALLQAGDASGDKCWQMPLDPAYAKLMDSPVADMCNAGGAEAGSVTAACFLQKFVSGQRWAHLDIAGVAANKERLATGRPLTLLAEYLIAQAK
jgi:leucyl aminopeptidase